MANVAEATWRRPCDEAEPGKTGEVVRRNVSRTRPSRNVTDSEIDPMDYYGLFFMDSFLWTLFYGP